MATLLIKCVCSSRSVPARRRKWSRGKGQHPKTMNVCSCCGKWWHTIATKGAR